MLDQVYAHIDQKNKDKSQDLFTHLLNTAIECSKIGEQIGLSNTAFLIGLLHDIGKQKESFQEKLINNSKSLVDHSSLGGVYILKLMNQFLSEIDEEKWGKLKVLVTENGNKNIYEFFDYNNILMYSIMSHHGQYNMIRKNNEQEYEVSSIIRAIREKENNNIENLYNKNIKFFRDKNIFIEEVYTKAFYEYIEIVNKLEVLIDRTSSNSNEAMLFYKSMYSRLLVSILKSADIKDTINSYEKIISDAEEEELKDVKLSFINKVKGKYDSFGVPDTPINIARNAIYEKILKKSKEDETGIYKLDLPTGAGKTLLSLTYGTRQMLYQSKTRFFYVTSYLSVLEQNASEIKKVLENDNFILEHHSNVTKNLSGKNDGEDDSLELTVSNYLLSDWTSPIILTTMVQFFNSIFKGKSSNLTRFKSMINSVIILDELQSLPIEILYLINLSLNFMKTVMNTSVVLSTATQPTFDYLKLDHRLDYGDSENKSEDIIDLSQEEKDVFKRVELIPYKNPECDYSLEDIKELILNNTDKSQLIILNTKSVVKDLYDLVSDKFESNDLYYLTTNLTAYHRLKKIEEIKERLKNSEKICVISTQLIEAGVDVDFDLVIRSLTGLDSVVQAMGRCNREGKKDKGQTYVISLHKDIEKISMLKGMEERKSSAKSVLIENKGNFDLDEIIEDYYKNLYSNIRDNDLSNILGLLSINEPIRDIMLKTNNENYIREGELLINLDTSLGVNLFQSFKDAYDEFELIKENQVSVLVKYDESREAINKIEDLAEKFTINYDFNFLKEIKETLQSLSRHTVSMNINKITDEFAVVLDGLAYILPGEYYDEKFGLNLEKPDTFIL